MNSELSSEQFLSVVSNCIEEDGSFSFSPHGGSMRPTVREGDTVLFVKPEEIRKYDVLLYRRPDGKAVLHRVIAVNGDRLTMRGDAQWRPEFNVPARNAVALAKTLTRGGRTRFFHSAEMLLAAWAVNAYNGTRRFFHRASGKLRRIIEK